MKLTEYLLAKYRSKNWGLSDDEAIALQIPVPLIGGWIREYQELQITADTAKSLMAILLRDFKYSHSCRRKDNAQWAMEALLTEFGSGIKCESLPKRTKAERAKSPVRKARRERYEQYIQRVKSGPVVQVYSTKQTKDEFLASYEWRKVRMQILKRDGARCACCGADRTDGLKMHVDHIKPRKLYPELALDLNNLQVLCEVCNHGKGNWDMTDWRARATSNS